MSAEFTTIEAGRPPFRRGLREVLSSRELLWMFGVRDLRLRYRQTALGVFWVVAQPLLGAGVLTLVFGRIARLPAVGVPYFLVSYSGFLLWQAFSATLTRSASSFLTNSALVSKVYFPRLVLPVSTALSTLVDFAIGSALLVVLLVWYRVPVTPRLVLFPVWPLAAMVLALGIGVIAGAVMVSYRDVQHVLPVALQLLVYASPVGYLIAAVPQGIRPLYLLNPMAGLLSGFRWSLMATPFPSPWSAAYALVCAAVAGLVGAAVLSRLEHAFADVI